MVVVPADAPDTEPDVPTVATPVLLDVQTPPDDASVRVILPDTHTEVAPDMLPALGNGFIVTVLVAVAVPQPVVTV